MSSFIAGFSGLAMTGEGGTQNIVDRIEGAKHFSYPFGFGDWRKHYDDIIEQKPDFIALFGHSMGGFYALRIAQELAKSRIYVDYVGIIDLTHENPPFFKVPPAGAYIGILEEFHSSFDRVKIGEDFRGSHIFHDLDAVLERNVSHIGSVLVDYTQNMIVETIEALTESEEKMENSVLTQLERELEIWLDPSNENPEQTKFWFELFAGVRKNILKPLTQSKINGIKTQLFVWQKFHKDEPIEFLASILGQEVRETGGRMQPIRETNASSDAAVVRILDKWWARGEAQKFGVRSPYWRFDGFGYPYGRGLMQLTLRPNYLKADDLLFEVYGIEAKLSDDYDLAMHPIISAMVAIGGCLTGMFRSTKLSDHMKQDGFNYFSARDVVNGDKNNKENGTTVGAEIASDSLSFFEALKTAYEAGSLNVVSLPKEAEKSPDIEVLTPSEQNILASYPLLTPNQAQFILAIKEFGVFGSQEQVTTQKSVLSAETSPVQLEQGSFINKTEQGTENMSLQSTAKSLFKSKTIWGVIATGVSIFVPQLSPVVDMITPDTVAMAPEAAAEVQEATKALIENISEIASILGLLYTAWARKVATEKIA